MMQEGFKRKLTAIFSADAVGYSRLMGDDEAATVQTITSYRNVISTLIKQHNGTVIDSPGDNLLAEFVSVVDAVQCAVAVQKELKARNDELPENRRMQFRIGINLGDVIQEDNRIYGDGVNIAARLEGLAEPGGICISKTAFDHIESKLPYGYEFLGNQTVKNITKPVGAYQVQMEPRVTVKGEAEDKRTPPVRRKVVFLGAVAALMLAVAVGFWLFYMRRPSIEPASADKMAYPLPEKPSIAVLPFTNMSDDSKQEYFCDGITEDLITDLSKMSGLFVIARNSIFAYKGKSVNIRQVAEDLGVRYVLEGGVRKADKNVRITAQLIDAIGGHHLWAERYDGKLENVFKLQDEVTNKIVSALALKLTGGEQKRLKARDTDSIAAYDAFLKGWSHYLRFTPEDFSKAISHFKIAIDLDPNYSRAYAGLAQVYEDSWNLSWQIKLGLSAADLRKKLRQNLEMAMKRNPSSLTHQALAKLLLFRRQHEDALAEAQYAITLDPNDPGCYAAMGWILIHANRIQEAIEFIERGKRLDPQNPGYYLYLFGHAQMSMGNYEQAVTSIKRALRYNPSAETAWGASLAVAYAHLGHIQEAEACLDAFISPCKVGRELLQHPYNNLEVTELFAEGLLKAGCNRSPSESYMFFEDNKLTEKELKDLLSDRHPSILSSGGWAEMPSNVSERWIEGDLLCYQLPEYPICGPVFSNPNNKSRVINEYFYLNDIWVFPFYVAE